MHYENESGKTVNIFNTSNGISGISVNAQITNTAPTTNSFAVSVDEILSVQVCEVEKFNLGFFNRILDYLTLLLLKKIHLQQMVQQV